MSKKAGIKKILVDLIKNDEDIRGLVIEIMRERIYKNEAIMAASKRGLMQRRSKEDGI